MGIITRKFPRPSFSLSLARARAFFALSSRSVFQYRRLLCTSAFPAQFFLLALPSFPTFPSSRIVPKSSFFLFLYSPIRVRSLALSRSSLHQLRGSILLSRNRPNDRDERERKEDDDDADDDEEQEKLSLLLPVSMYAFSSIVFFPLHRAKKNQQL